MVFDTRRFVVRFCATGALVTLFENTALGETLQAALAASYRDNPTLEAARAGQRAAKEALPQAKAGWKPNITLESAATQQWSDTNISPSTSLTTKSLTIQLSQPIFRGFKTVEGIKKANTDIAAGQFNLRITEQSILFDVVTSYLDVWRDQKIIKFRKQNVNNLVEQIKATKERFKAGELTRTDVEQSKASLAQAKASLATSQSNLQSSLATYDKLVGHEALSVALPAVPTVPDSLNDALSQATHNHPKILAARSLAMSAGFAIAIAKGDLLPEISLSATGQVSSDPSVGVDRSTTAQIQLTGKVSLYDGGRTYSSIRQAQQTESKNRIEVIGAAREIRKSVTEAWSNLASAQQALISTQSEVYASRLALTGVQQEYQVGSRSTTDVLNAEQSLLNAEISQVSTARDTVYAAYNVIYSIGELDINHVANQF
jgi:outer membrane protein